MLKRHLAILGFTLALLGTGIFLTVILFYNFSDEAPSKKTITIVKNSSLPQIAKFLEEEGIVKSAPRFKILTAIKGKARFIKPGEYEFDLPAHPKDILRKITLGQVKTYRVTFPEGLTVKEIAKTLHKKKLANYKKFMLLFEDKEFLSQFKITSPSLEGYLFPETYVFDKTMSEKKIATIMIEKFFREARRSIIRRGEVRGMSLHQVVTLASMIEKETGVDEERPIISSVFHNRLKTGMRLQCDPTVIYGIKNFNGNLTKKDLQTKTPYNTYVINGLPEGPIANPGIDSLKAAVVPTDTEFLYFVAKKDGSHVFSKTYKEHLANVKKYQLGK